MKTTVLGVMFACMSTSLGGMTVTLTRLIINDTDPLSLTFLRYGVGALVLFGIMLKYFKLPHIVGRDLFRLTVLGVIMFAAFPFFMARALEDTTAARAALLFATMPIITILLGSLLKVERFTFMKLAGIIVAGTGLMIALGERVDAVAPNAFRGDVLMFIGMLCTSTFNVFSGRYLVKYGNLPVMVYTMFVGVLLLFVLALIFGNPFSGSLSFDFNGWFILFMLAVPGAALMQFSWGKALQAISPTQAAITIGFNPITAILLAWWLLNEPMTLNVVIGFCFVVVAIFITNHRPKSARLAAPAAGE